MSNQANQPDTPADTSPTGKGPTESQAGFVVYGLDPPPAKPKEVELTYRAVLVAEEKTPPRRDRTRSRTHAPDDPSWDHLVRKIRQIRRVRNIPRLESHWHECLFYPFRILPALAVLGFALAWLTCLTFGLVAANHSKPEDLLLSPQGWAMLVLMLTPLAFVAGFFNRVLHSAAHGETRAVRWSALVDPRMTGKTVLIGLASFLAGPVIPAAVGLFFWLHAGTLEWIDRLILFQLSLVAVTYWLLVFLTASLAGRWTQIAPAAVIQHARRLGPSGLVALALAYGIALFHAWLWIIALESTHHSFAGVFLLLICSGSLLYWTTFILRWLGICWFRHVAGSGEGVPHMHGASGEPSPQA